MSADSQSRPQQFESYKKLDLLGKGSFGKAFLVQCGSDGVYLIVNKLIICLEFGCDKEGGYC